MSGSLSRRDLFRRKSAPAEPAPVPAEPRAMPTEPQAVDAGSTSQPPLPELVDTLLDADTVDQLLRDIASCTQLLEIVPKHHARGHVGDRTISLDAARDLLRRRAVRAVQLRYRYDDAEWWDTLVVTDTGTRLVRIRHEFDSPTSS